MQEGDAELKNNNASDCPSDDKKGGAPTVNSLVYHRANKASEEKSNIPNGTASQEKIRSIQNGGGASSSLPASSSSSYLNPVLNVDNDSTDLAEKSLFKGRTLSSEESDCRTNDKKQKTGNVENDNSSGNEGDEGLSGDDCCIYTYKGDQFADLPNSFFPVEMAEHEGNQQHRASCSNANPGRRIQHPNGEGSDPGSSPEMDYLEMDFDPEPSLEQDSEEDVDGFERKAVDDNSLQDLAEPNQDSADEPMLSRIENLTKPMETSQDDKDPKPGPSNENFYLCSTKKISSSNFISNNCSRTKENLDSCYLEHCSVKESSDLCDLENTKFREDKLEGEGKINDSPNGELLGGRRLDTKNVWTENKDVTMKSENESDCRLPFAGIMLWTEQEAISKQVTLVSSEVSCGATAVINVMMVLKIRFSIEKVIEGISTRIRSDSASIPQYLVSRSFAGVAHENLITGIHHASHGTLYAKFFQMYPRRNVVLSRWLSHWMKLGAVPIATTNDPGSTESSGKNDSRHHQMIFGVNSKGIHLTNPMECLQEEELWNRLVTPSVLNISRQEIVSRWSPETNLKPLMHQSDERWKTMNVLGQVVNVIRESRDSTPLGKFLIQHVTIPASSGITLVVPRDSSGYEELVSTPDLPPLSLPPKSN